MELISTERRRELLSGARHVKKIELLDAYTADAETFRAWQAGDETAVAASYALWGEAMAADRDNGLTFRRVRVISEPLSDYQRMAVQWSGAGVDGGEQLRWLPRRLVSAVPLPGNDCFVLDDEAVMFNVHGGDCQGALVQFSRDHEDVKFCRDAFGMAWSLAVPHHDYKPE